MCIISDKRVKYLHLCEKYIQGRLYYMHLFYQKLCFKFLHWYVNNVHKILLNFTPKVVGIYPKWCNILHGRNYKR